MKGSKLSALTAMVPSGVIDRLRAIAQRDSENGRRRSRNDCVREALERGLAVIEGQPKK